MRKSLMLAISLLAAHLSFTLEISEAQVRVSVAPSQADVTVKQTRQFTATVSGTKDQRVSWSVIPGGNGKFGPGFIDSSGLYRAPANAPEPPFVTIKATSVADPTASGTASVIVRDVRNFNQSNADDDLDATNYGDSINFGWINLPTGTTRIVLSRATTQNGPWTKVLIDEFAIDMRPSGNMVHDATDLVPLDAATDYFYRIEAFSATGTLLKSYAPVFVPKFVGPSS